MNSDEWKDMLGLVGIFNHFNKSSLRNRIYNCIFVGIISTVTIRLDVTRPNTDWAIRGPVISSMAGRNTKLILGPSHYESSGINCEIFQHGINNLRSFNIMNHFFFRFKLLNLDTFQVFLLLGKRWPIISSY